MRCCFFMGKRNHFAVNSPIVSVRRRRARKTKKKKRATVIRSLFVLIRSRCEVPRRGRVPLARWYLLRGGVFPLLHSR